MKVHQLLGLMALCCSLSAIAQGEKQIGQVSQGIPVQAGAGTIIGDPGFEGGTPNAVWTEASTNFGTPICDAGGCGVGGGTGANSGSFWLWFGGILAFEEGSVSQMITIPTGGLVDLSFFLEMPTCDDVGFFEVLVDGNQEFIVDETDANCGVVGYNQISVDLTAYQGQTVNFELHSIVQGSGTAATNFFIDDLTLVVSGEPPVPPAPPVSVPSLQNYGILALVFFVMLMGLRRSKRS